MWVEYLQDASLLRFLVDMRGADVDDRQVNFNSDIFSFLLFHFATFVTRVEYSISVWSCELFSLWLSGGHCLARPIPSYIWLLCPLFISYLPLYYILFPFSYYSWGMTWWLCWLLDMKQQPLSWHGLFSFLPKYDSVSLALQTTILELM